MVEFTTRVFMFLFINCVSFLPEPLIAYRRYFSVHVRVSVGKLILQNIYRLSYNAATFFRTLAYLSQNNVRFNYIV